MSDRIMLKLGGSVITDKSGDCAIDRDRLSGIARDIARARKDGILIVHGAGSCGHPEAKRYHLDTGAAPGQAGGIAVTHHAVSALNAGVVAALRQEGIEAVGIHPLHAGYADGGRLVAFECRHLDQMLALGIVPVIHGDVVMDRSRGACIVSGDQLIRFLAGRLSLQRVGLATDVPGVLDRGMVVPVITPATIQTLQIGSSTHTDVTGGMRGKIAELLELAEAGIGSEIFHVSRIPDFLAGRDCNGTRIIT
ncbi:MAG TPA: isopentenyl phosphate kinase [Methanoregulaceae archaeon]|nr:isopentenyl phosphate kinase [Methanoregulaceae archaeon]HPD75289.1 isopentenyl phosphate kinase [Methanoregulaceae archaeon]HRY74787.1 isopentenyl phosphate kinase [Methanoregulaceae archaeon]